MIRIKQLRINIESLTKPNLSGKVNEEEYSLLHNQIVQLLGVEKKDIDNITIKKKSIDSRKGRKPAYIYNVDIYSSTPVEQKRLSGAIKRAGKKGISIDISDKPEKEFDPVIAGAGSIGAGIKKPVIIGAGPAGLFCAYILALKGLSPILIEQGKRMEERVADVERFWNDVSELNPYSNVSFGEGGAGTFSDGKLNTSVKDPSGRIEYVKKVFVDHGAPEEIMYLSKPHIGTDELRHVIVNLRNSIIANGGTVLFGTRLTGIIVGKTNSGRYESNQTACITGIRVYDIENDEYKDIECDRLVLATGHSARDTYAMLKDILHMEQKDFAIGLRVEHSQEFINKTQYGEYWNMLPAADYKLRYHSSNGRAVYSFCMCPGGHVVNSSTEKGMTVTNGMSDHSRDSGYANSAIVVNVTKDDFGSGDVLAGVEFQRKWEKAAYELGCGNIPKETFGEFGDGKLKKCLPDYVSMAIGEAMAHFDSQMPGFADKDVMMYGVETRTSAPVRILRDESGNSNVAGIYPCGEGAGYAGGIMSAAVDGIKVAHMMIMGYNL